ncbi:MAG TPA: hypothetical protein VF678_16670 [bacterium]
MKDNKKTVSHEELQAAIRKFQQSGGIIQKLPDQKSYSHQGVGVKFANVESSEGQPS